VRLVNSTRCSLTFHSPTKVTDSDPFSYFSLKAEDDEDDDEDCSAPPKMNLLSAIKEGRRMEETEKQKKEESGEGERNPKRN
jgi:hypothetical protein